MDKNKIVEAFKKVKEEKKREFVQSYDLIFNLKNIDTEKTENQLDIFVILQTTKGKDIKVCAFVGPELREEAGKTCSLVIELEEFPKYSDKKKIVKLASDYDYFISQANIMPKVAQVFGKALGVRGKMPNPKLGCVVPPKAQLGPLIERLKKTLRLKSGKAPMLQTVVGNEGMEDEIVIDNIKTTIDQVTHALPSAENNIGKILLKKTMGKVVDIK